MVNRIRSSITAARTVNTQNYSFNMFVSGGGSEFNSKGVFGGNERNYLMAAQSESEPTVGELELKSFLPTPSGNCKSNLKIKYRVPLWISPVA